MAQSGTQFLPSESVTFAVTKHLKYGRTKQRRLRLSPDGVENLTLSGEVTSLHPYAQIRRAYQEGGDVVIRYCDDHTYRYTCRAAPDLLAQILARLANTRARQRQSSLAAVALVSPADPSDTTGLPSAGADPDDIERMCELLPDLTFQVRAPRRPGVVVPRTRRRV